MIANQRFIRHTVARLSPIVSLYAEKFKARGFHVEVEDFNAGLLFALRYNDGGIRGLSISEDKENNKISLNSLLTAEDGQGSIRSRIYSMEDWKDEGFRDRLQQAIDDFLASAPRHGGIQYSVRDGLSK